MGIVVRCEEVKIGCKEVQGSNFMMSWNDEARSFYEVSMYVRHRNQSKEPYETFKKAYKASMIRFSARDDFYSKFPKVPSKVSKLLSFEASSVPHT